jgi:hypothetical protein
VSRALVAIALLPAAAPPAHGQPVCHYFEVAEAEPGTTVLYGINDYGDMAGGYTYRTGPKDDDLHQYGFAVIGGQFYRIDWPNSFDTIAYGINNSGQVVGAWNEPVDNSYPNGFLYQGGGYGGIDYPGSFFTQVWGISDNGAMAGDFSFHNPDEEMKPYLGFHRSPSGSYAMIVLDADQSTTPMDVNDSGTVVGFSGWTPFLWQGGQFTGTIQHPDGYAVIPYGINNDGTVVGFVMRSDLSQAGFIRSPEGQFREIDCGGMLGTALQDINNLGAAVGTHLIGIGPYGRAFYTSPTLKILPETTRFKPQRSDQPIEIRFRGPYDLASATLEIKDPEGRDVTVDPPPELEPVPNGTPFEWRLFWRGPWTRNDPNTGQPERLPTGNYRVVVKGTQTAASEEMESEPYDKVSLVEVKKLELLPCGAIPGVSCPDAGAVIADNLDSSGAPMPGGGKALFPDADLPGGDFRRTILIKAEVEPDLGPDAARVTVHFQAIDVDDPSASTGPVDNDGLGTSADNRNESATIVPAVQGSPARGGAAVSQFRTSVQQGNNYRLAASTYEPWLSGLAGVPSSQIGEATHTSGETLTPGVQLSEMVTVWRTLHLELTSFDPSPRTQADLDYQGFWTNLDRRRLDDSSSPFFSITTDGLLDHTTASGWRGGDVNPQPSAGRDFRVSGNSARSLSVGSGNMCNLVAPNACRRAPANAADRQYVLGDDKLSSLVDPPYDVSLLRALLESVYIALDARPGPALPWTRNLSQNGQAALSGTVPNSLPYWSVLLAHGFEGDVSQDYDPTDDGRSRPDPPIVGRCWPPGPQQTNAVVFLEAIRDYIETASATCIKPTVGFAEFYRGTTAHEVLHALSLEHDGDTTGGVMCAALKIFANQPNRNAITEAQKARLRGISAPLAPSSVRDVPGCTGVTC